MSIAFDKRIMIWNFIEIKTPQKKDEQETKKHTRMP